MFARLEFIHNGSRCAMTGVDYGAIEIPSAGADREDRGDHYGQTNSVLFD